MINIFKLILEVKDRPLLYDPNYGKSSRNFEVKKRAWEEITKQILDDYSEDLPDEVKEQKVSLVRRKWKSVSDYYKRERKEGARVGQVRPKKYEFADALAFLDPFVVDNEWPRKTSHNNRIVCTDSNDSVIYLEQDDDETLKTEVSEQLEEEEESPQDVLIKSESSQFKVEANNKRHCKSKRTDPLSTEEQSDVTLANNEDGDKLFLLSFLPEMKSMSYVQKIEFKIQMLKTLKNIKCYQNNDSAMSSDVVGERKRKKRERSSDSSCFRNDDS